ncbi:VOC family protein [Streptomyces sp. Ag109_G2-6]|uniref:VOC family protein n=1 Tax=Streptomyces TaxID=1883 RepID=UPI0013319C8D
MKLCAITLDCSDPRALAAFYQQATGLEPHPKSDVSFAGLNCEDGLFRPAVVRSRRARPRRQASAPPFPCNGALVETCGQWSARPASVP